MSDNITVEPWTRRLFGPPECRPLCVCLSVLLFVFPFSFSLSNLLSFYPALHAAASFWDESGKKQNKGKKKIYTTKIGPFPHLPSPLLLPPYLSSLTLTSTFSQKQQH